MSDLEGLATVIRNARSAFNRQKNQIYALCLFYQAKALQELQQRQGFGINIPGEFWTNRTGQAVSRSFGEAFREEGAVGWLIAHGVDYGVYLELANDRKHEALRPIVEKLAPQFLADVRRLVND